MGQDPLSNDSLAFSLKMVGNHEIILIHRLHGPPRHWCLNSKKGGAVQYLERAAFICNYDYLEVITSCNFMFVTNCEYF